MEEDRPEEAQGEPTLNSLVLREWQELLSHFEPGRLRDADASVSTRPSLTPELAEGAQAKEQGVEANEPMAPASPSRAKSMNSENPAGTRSHAGSEQDEWQQRLTALGLGSLRLPDNGVLCRAWEDFLRRLEAPRQQDSKTKGKKPEGRQ